jgi:hypothetical protein
MPSSHWKAPLFLYCSRAPAGVDALPQPPLRVKLAAALARFRDTKTRGPIPAPDSFTASLVGGDTHPWWYSSFRSSPQPPFFLAQSFCQQRATLGARSRHGHDQSRPRSRSRSSHRLTRHFHCQQQKNNKITIVGAPSHSIMPSRCCRLPCRLNSHCPSETAGQGCPLLRQLPRATRATTMGTTPTTVRRPQCAIHSMALAR